MGYRSEVAYTIRFANDDRGIQTFNIFLADARQGEDTKRCFDEHESVFKVDTLNYKINFYADQVKWYADFEDVKCHMALIELAEKYCEETVDKENNYTPLGYMFYQVGEDLTDIEEKFGGDWDYQWLGVHRYIEKDW